MAIGQIAGAVGVATSTIRYYEREGLLNPVSRSSSGYRMYDKAALERLRFIRSAQSVGFSLTDIKTLFSLDERTSCKRVQGMIEERLGDIAIRIDELRTVRRNLTRALNRCRTTEEGCPILTDLRQTDSRSRDG